ncbi:MAG TPA: RNA methyltransferase [Casimicrobiaceae bacterium]|nr:RNA methyltransferase [Casimicrobiaceae bacterium]
MIRVTSRSNPRLKEASRLVASSRDRRKAGKCVLEGEHLVLAYARRYGEPETLIVAEPLLEHASARKLIDDYGDRALVVPPTLFDDIASLPAGIGMLAVVVKPRPTPSRNDRFCLLLDDVQDPGNVGSMLRTAAAAGVSAAYLSAHCAFAWSPKVLRAGMGAHFHLDIHEHVDLVDWASAYRRRGGNVVATVNEGGDDVHGARLVAPIAVAIGNEGAGLSAALIEAATMRVTIPMPGGTESLNAAASAAIVLYECVRRGVKEIAGQGN